MPEIWYISDVDDELVAVGREYRDRQPYRIAIPVEGNPENLVHRDPAVRGHLEEVRFNGDRRPHGNPVAVTHLLDAARLAQVLDGSSLDVLRTPQPVCASVAELHRAAGRLQCIRRASPVA